MRLKGRKGT